MIHQFPGRRLGAHISLIKRCFKPLTLVMKLNNSSLLSIYQILVQMKLFNFIYKKGLLNTFLKYFSANGFGG